MNRPLIVISALTGAFILYKVVKSDFTPTWDAKTNEIIGKLHPKIRKDAAKVVNYLHKKGINVRFISGLRTFEHQNRLYAQGRTAPGDIVTKAQAGQSYHNYGLAIDTIYPKQYEDYVVKAFENKGFEWGGNFGNFPDPPHFQKRFGYRWNDFLTRNKYIKGTHYPVF